MTKGFQRGHTNHFLNLTRNLKHSVYFPLSSFPGKLILTKNTFLALSHSQVIIIHSSDTDGRAILGRFQTTSQTNYDDIDVRANVESIVEFEPKLESFVEHLAELRTAQSRVYLLYAK